MINYKVTPKDTSKEIIHPLWEVDAKLCELTGKKCFEDSYSNEFYMLIFCAYEISEVKVATSSFLELAEEVEKFLTEKKFSGHNVYTYLAIVSILKTYNVEVWRD